MNNYCKYTHFKQYAIEIKYFLHLLHYLKSCVYLQYQKKQQNVIAMEIIVAQFYGSLLMKLYTLEPNEDGELYISPAYECFQIENKTVTCIGTEYTMAFDQRDVKYFEETRFFAYTDETWNIFKALQNASAELKSEFENTHYHDVTFEVLLTNVAKRIAIQSQAEAIVNSFLKSNA